GPLPTAALIASSAVAPTARAPPQRATHSPPAYSTSSTRPSGVYVRQASTSLQWLPARRVLVNRPTRLRTRGRATDLPPRSAPPQPLPAPLRGDVHVGRRQLARRRRAAGRRLRPHALGLAGRCAARRQPPSGV